MADEPDDNLSPGWLSGLYRWLKRISPPPELPSGSTGGDSPDRIPSRIGHYAIRRKLGAGGMGVVYEAEDERLKRTVALKLMLSLEHDETSRKRFWREAQAAASVNHPHVCQVCEVGEDGGRPFIAMELLEGEPLNKTLRRGPLSVDQALPIAADMLEALGAIHARGIVHRDLKPSTVFLATHERQAPRFRSRATRAAGQAGFARQRDSLWHHLRHTGIHGAGAHHRRSRRCARRSLRGRRDPVRDAGGSACVRRPHGDRGRQCHADRAAPCPRRASCSGGGRSSHPACALEDSGRTARIDPGHGRRAECPAGP